MVFNRFSKCLPLLEGFEGVHLGEKFQVSKYFTFAMAWWILRASTKFENFPLSNCTMCQQVFASARRFWGWAFGCKVSAAQIFYFWNGMAKTFRINNIWNFATFNLYTVPAKTQYLQRYSTDFRNLCLSSKILREGVCVESLLLQWQGENFAYRNIWNFATFNQYTVPAKNLYLQRHSTDFRNLCLSSNILRQGIWVESCRMGRYFNFPMATWKLCASTTFEILLLSTCTLCQEKSNISKDIQPIFEIFASAQRYWGRAFVWKVAYGQVF